VGKGDAIAGKPEAPGKVFGRGGGKRGDLLLETVTPDRLAKEEPRCLNSNGEEKKTRSEGKRERRGEGRQGEAKRQRR